MSKEPDPSVFHLQGYSQIIKSLNQETQWLLDSLDLVTCMHVKDIQTTIDNNTFDWQVLRFFATFQKSFIINDKHENTQSGVRKYLEDNIWAYLMS